MKEVVTIKKPNTEESVGFPVSVSYMREHIYLPMSKMFALAWDNIYHQTYEPFLPGRPDTHYEHKPVAEYIKMENIMESFDKGILGKCFKNKATGVNVEFRDQTKIRQDDVIQTSRKELLESVGIYYDSKSNSFVKGNHLRSNTTIPKRTMTFTQCKFTSPRKIQSNLKMARFTKTSPNFHSTQLTVSPIKLIKEVPSDSSFASPEIMRKVKMERPLTQLQKKYCNLRKKVFQFSPEKSALFNDSSLTFTLISAKLGRSATSMQIRRNRTDALNGFFKSITESKDKSTQDIQSFTALKKRLITTLSSAKELTNTNDTDYSRKDKKVAIQNYKIEKAGFVYGRNGRGHFLDVKRLHIRK